MASSSALWFSIETAFSEIEQLCIEARAAELVQQKQKEEAERVSELSSGRTPPASADAESALFDARQTRASDLAKDLAFREAHPHGPDLVEIRDRLRKRIAWLKTELATGLAEHEVYYALFPLVAYTDELVASITRGQSKRWEPLQGELYEVDNGGELFFTLLDDRLRRDETSPLIFEVFLFCLKDGFVGMYQGDARKLDEYCQRLVQRIPLKPVDGRLRVRERAPVMLVPFPWKAYALAAAAMVLAWVVLALMAPTALQL